MKAVDPLPLILSKLSNGVSLDILRTTKAILYALWNGDNLVSSALEINLLDCESGNESAPRLHPNSNLWTL
ncbi:MAG: hypothetical protein ACRD10_03975 [Terriglobia bacterium]